ncbi:hypothetical protein CFC21_058652 [Triticum aestivum]|uniref:No apical meristem-associated C-terminal domain-containing protein n=2 Tax=Triticum aestivum TaxID=4565 RepID=A0A9R1DAD9_WHEAT|nr:hypothetical protein CFC21_005820 [Triticum aestivum]KAF7050263.1 hypothetical protein CFC21_058652 [Triticum aestivum]
MTKRGRRSGVGKVEYEAKKVRIALLQEEVARLEREIVVEKQRAKETNERFEKAKEESSGTVARYLIMNVEDLNHEECKEYYQELMRINQEIENRLSLESMGSSMPTPQLHLSSMESQTNEEK